MELNISNEQRAAGWMHVVTLEPAKIPAPPGARRLWNVMCLCGWGRKGVSCETAFREGQEHAAMYVPKEV